MAKMTAYRYHAVDVRGQERVGVVHAADEETAGLKLKDQGLIPTRLRDVGSGFLNRDLHLSKNSRRVSTQGLAQFSGQLATLLSAGMPLLQGLESLESQNSNAALVAAIAEVRDDIQAGSTFASALERRPEVFPELMVSLVRAGEVSGTLDETLHGISEVYTRQVALHDTIKSAMMYPTIVFIISILGVIGIVWFIVPVFEQMYNNLHGTLPALTQALVSLSHQMVWLGPLLVVLIIGLTVGYRMNRDRQWMRARRDPLMLRLPLMGSVVKQTAISRVSHNLSIMVRAGIPLTQALESVAPTAGNQVIEAALLRASKSLESGSPLGQALRAEPVFPPMMVEMVSSGEQSGSLEAMFARLAEFYDHEVQSATERLTAAIEPLMVVVIGVIIGFMVIALYLPIFNISTLIGNS
jgi:type IV pilus assembly protein PilC